MIYRFLLFLIALSLVASENLEITSDAFEADNINKQFTFKGNVKAKKNKDILTTNKLVVIFDKSNQAKKYKASGNSHIEVFLKKAHYLGSAKTILYFPKKMYYKLIGNAILKETNNKKEVRGEQIEINLKNQKVKVLSNNKKPVKLIFEIDKK